jgi:hypothetical protein
MAYFGEDSTVGDEAIHVANASICADFEGEWAISCRDGLLANAVPSRNGKGPDGCVPRLQSSREENVSPRWILLLF